MKKKKILIASIIGIVAILGVSYAWFNYFGEDDNNKAIAGDIRLHLENETDGINILSGFPQTVEQARSKTNNTIEFTVSGKNESKDNIYYEIRLKEGDSIDGKERFKPSELVFDLSIINDDESETMLLDAVSIDDFNDHKIWVDTVLSGETNVERRYKLRAWLSESITIGEGRNVTYSQDDYPNHYASVKVAVEADMNAKSLPAASITRSSYVENGKSYFMTKLSNDYKLEDEGELLDTNDVIKLEITNPDNLLYFQYRDSKGNENTSNNTSLDLTYTYNKNETIDIQVFTISRNDTNVSTDLKFKVTKNGSVVQEYVKHVNVIGNNYCLNNGFNNLADCILVTENLSNSVSAAKSYILSKGAPDVNTTAPTYQYVEEQTENVTYTGTSGYPNWSFGAKYTFDATNGKFTLKQSDGATNATTYVALSSDLIDKYTCGTSNSSYVCSTIYKVTSVDTNNNKITGTKITNKMTGSMDSQVGLYKVLDNDGDSYIYRGNVTNNNVLFGGYYWKIIRINGDGSIRLIFNGKTLSADGNKTAGYASSISTANATGTGSTYPFNSNPGGPTYVGYMNTESENYWTTTTLATYSNFAENTAYYFADDFETYTDAYGNKQFKLKESGAFTSKVKDLTETQLNGNLYTCSGTNANLICNRLVKVNSRASNTSVTGYYITYSPNYDSNTSLTKADVEKNENESTAKKQLELWYHDKFMNNQNNGKLVITYLVDNPFCNDRSILNTYTNGSYTLNNSYKSGYLLTTHTYYAGRTRLFDATNGNKSATLVCANANDLFGVESGNGKLTYPVGLITADEVALAGGKYDEENSNFYLRTNGYFWTMTPSDFDSSFASAREFHVRPEGLMSSYYYVTAGYGLRAVINLKSDSLISSGYGTVESPYVIE